MEDPTVAPRRSIVGVHLFDDDADDACQAFSIFFLLFFEKGSAASNIE